MREIRLIQEAIKKLKLNLKDLSVFTEGASGHYKWTPIIAALAGAKRVYAIAKNSKYGKRKDIKREIDSISKKLKVDKQIKVVFDKDFVSKADIITNLGFVRPINKKMINKLKPTAVIPLMREVWEFRNSDLDLKECRRKGIMVLGTNENDKRIEIFDYIGLVAIKLLLEAGIELIGSRILIVGDDIFGGKVIKYLKNFSNSIKKVKHLNKKSRYGNYEAIIIAERKSNKLLIGADSEVSFKYIAKINPDVKIIHISGNIDRDEIRESGLDYYPQSISAFGYMSCNLDYVGPKPVIDLHAAGLKVGELAARLRLRDTAARAASEQLSTAGLVQLLRF